MNSEVKNAADEKQVKKADKRLSLREEQERSDLAFIMSRPQGRRFIWRLLAHCKVFGTVVSPNGSQTYYNAGQQDVGHFIMGEVTSVKPDGFIQMMKENQEEI